MNELQVCENSEFGEIRVQEIKQIHPIHWIKFIQYIGLNSSNTLD